MKRNLVFTIFNIVLFCSICYAGPIILTRDIPVDGSYTEIEVKQRGKIPLQYYFPNNTKSVVIDVPYTNCTSYTVYNVNPVTKEKSDPVTIKEFRVQKEQIIPCKE